MPNWVVNRVTVTGSEEDIERFKALVTSDESVFDFNRIKPMPKELNIVSGGIEHLCIDAYLKSRKTEAKSIEEFLEEINLPDWFKPDGKDHGVVFDRQTGPGGLGDIIAYGEVYCALKERYGATSWYDWCVRNWGTKWYADDASIESESPTQLQYRFETAWNVPVEIYQALAEMFPDIDMHILFADEALGINCGTVEATGGAVETYWHGDFEFACEVWGYDPKEMHVMYA